VISATKFFEIHFQGNSRRACREKMHVASAVNPVAQAFLVHRVFSGVPNSKFVLFAATKEASFGFERALESDDSGGFALDLLLKVSRQGDENF
jgi:hypothetical protein